MRTPKTTHDCLNQFQVAAIGRWSAMLDADVRRANKLHESEGEAVAHILELGDSGREELAQFLAHPCPSVRSAAAAWLLRYKTKESFAVLHEVADLHGFIGFEASQCIERWLDGTWALDPGP